VRRRHVDPFDPALGTLDSITVAITGALTVSGTTAPNLVPQGPNGTLVPLPYLFQIDVDQEFDGSLGKYFQFNGPAHFILPNLSASGVGEAVIH
jgi:hypothetical protein